MGIDWKSLEQEAEQIKKEGYDTIFGMPYKDANGEDVGRGLPGETPVMEFVSVDKVENTKFPDPKGRPKLEFKFKLGDKNVTDEKAQGTRFFEAFCESTPQPGDKVKITRTGVAFDTQYKVVVVERAANKQTEATPEQPAPQPAADPGEAPA